MERESLLYWNKFKIKIRNEEEICTKLTELSNARAENLAHPESNSSEMKKEIRTQAYMIQVLEWCLGGPEFQLL